MNFSNNNLILIVLFALLIIYFFYLNKENFTNTFKNPYNLNLLRSKIKEKNNNIVECNIVDYKDIIPIEKTLNIPNLYLHTADCHSCHINEKNKPLRAERIRVIKNITNTLKLYMNYLLYCNNDIIVNSYKICIKNLLIHISSNNVYTHKNNNEGLMYLNFSFIPFLCQSYLLVLDIFNSNEKSIFEKYLFNIYNIVKPAMIKKSNNWKIGFGRCSFLCGIILKNKSIYNEGNKILKYTLEIINKDGFFETEMNRGQRSAIYNIKAGCFLFDLIYIRNISSSISISEYEKKKISLVANNLVNAWLFDNSYNTKSINKYALKLNLTQELLTDDKISKFIQYDFVIDSLSPANKEYIVNNLKLQELYNPIAIGL